MQLLSLNEKGEVDLNKTWIKTNPVLWRLYERDNKPKKGDTQARERDKAHREYMFLYKMFDPVDSELSNYPLMQRFIICAKMYKIPYEVVKVKLRKATAKDPDVYEEKGTIKEDDELQEAYDMYQGIINSLPTVRLYNAAKFSIDRKIDYLTNFDPGAVDKQGKLLVTFKQHSDAIADMDKDLTSLDKYTRKMKEEMGDAVKTKSTLVLGLNEGKYVGDTFDEGNPLALPEKKDANDFIDEL